MPTFDITTLRPTGTTSQHLAEALERALVARDGQSAEMARLQEQRDATLLDGTSSAMAQADAALIAGRDLAEKIASVIDQLGTRLAAARETETVSKLNALRVDAEATEEALAAWWVKQRKKLAAELMDGIKLRRIAEESRLDHEQAARVAAEQYPGQTFKAPILARVDAHSWPDQVSDALRVIGAIPDALDGLLRAGDPQPTAI